VVTLVATVTFTGAATADQPGIAVARQPVPESRSPSILDPVFVRAESVSDYAPNVITRQIIQDATGDLWFASFSGVIRYDGSVYTNITNEVSLAPARAFSLLRDRHDHIWIGTIGAGAYRYDGVSYTRITTRDGLSSDRVLSMMEDRDGNIWFGHESGGATRLAGKQFTTFGAKDGFTDDDVSSMAQDGTGRIWFGTRKGLFHFDGASFGTLEQASALPTGGYIPTLIDGHGQLWFGGGSGLHHFDGVQLRRYSADPVWAMHLAADGSIWFAGQSELHRIQPSSTGQPVPAPAWTLSEGSLGSAGEVAPAIVDAGTVGAMVFNLFQDRDGVLWIGTFGVARLDGDRIRYLGAMTERHDALGRPVSDEGRQLAQRFGTGR
jgi:ligand-binding sensor domain-containing protein